jgi:hypothetical protein
LTELSVELGCERAREGVGSAAGCERHDKHDRLLRPCLGVKVRGGDAEAGQSGQRHQDGFCFGHGVSPLEDRRLAARSRLSFVT